MIDALGKMKQYLTVNGRMMAFIAIMDAIASQIYITHLYNGFRISISVLILPVFYYFYRNIHPLIMALWIGFFGLIFRGVIGISTFGSFANALVADYQIFFFDITYGVLFYFLFYHAKEKNFIKWVPIVWFCDFSSNLIEMTTRFGLTYALQMEILDSLFTVALIRTLIATGIVFLLRYYKVILLKEQRVEKYKAMYTLLSDLKSEVYYMKENMDYIEDVMSDAYLLYEHMSDSEDEESKQVSLRIAKDVHEIKKNYIKVVDGIAKIGINQDIYKNMAVKELLGLLDDYYKTEIKHNGIQFKIENKVRRDILIKEHFLFMSIIRNLVSNAIEALDHPEKTGIIKLVVSDTKDTLHISVTDNGHGIKADELDFIFNPGYSTKFNPQTGDIYRGLGLTLVKDIVHESFFGQVDVSSDPNGTTFNIHLPLNQLEESK